MKEKTDSLIDLHLFRSSQPVATWKHNLKVSVILPVYNGQAFLREALESILRQTYRNFEIIAVDDGSTDASSEILQEYRKDISIRAQENSGVCVARNRGVEIASGDLLAFIDQDDIWYHCCPVKMEQPWQRTLVKMPIFQHVAILEILIRSASIIKILL